MGSNRVVVLTALPLEAAAVRALLPGRVRHDLPAGTIVEEAVLPGTGYSVCLACTGPGTGQAAVVAERVISWARPAAVLFVGVAGAVKGGAALGDVVAATRVLGYQGGRDTTAGFRARPEAWDGAHRLLQVAQFAQASTAWLRFLPGDLSSAPGVHFKPVASGDVLKDAGDSPLAELLDAVYNDAVAIEMEAAGVARAAHHASVDLLVIRGISDMSDGTKSSSDDGGWQPRAAGNAAAFACGVIAGLPAPDAAAESRPWSSRPAGRTASASVGDTGPLPDGVAGPAAEAGSAWSRPDPGAAGHGGHVFISAAAEDAGPADQLHRDLQAAGIRVWRDVNDLEPGDYRPTAVRQAITDGALVFLACFSSRSAALATSHINAQLLLAIEQQRLRRPDLPWLIPVRFDNTTLPDLDLGGGRTLASLHRADLFGPQRADNTERLVGRIQDVLGRASGSVQAAVPPLEPGPSRQSKPGWASMIDTLDRTYQEWIGWTGTMISPVAMSAVLHLRTDPGVTAVYLSRVPVRRAARMLAASPPAAAGQVLKQMTKQRAAAILNNIPADIAQAIVEAM